MKKDKPAAKGFQHRQSRRISLKIKFKISGRDINGNQFEELVESLDLGSNGGSFPLQTEVKVGSTLKLAGPKGLDFLVRTVWVNIDAATRRRLLGFQLLESREDWVIHSQARPAKRPKP